MKNRTSSKDATASDVTVTSPSLGRRLTALLVAFTLTVQTLPAFAGVYYIHTDHLDTPRAVTNQQNQVVWQNLPLTEPFGTSAPNEDPDGDGQTFTLNLRFPGQYFDQEANAHYNYYRDHYVPSLGRYGQSDPIGLYGGINTYSYVNGNPLIFVDPEGDIPAAIAACAAYPACASLVAISLAALGNAISNTIRILQNNRDDDTGLDGAGAGAGAGSGTGNGTAQCEKQPCSPCTPYAKGTVGYIGPHTDHDHFPIGRPHLNLFVVNQRPSDCKFNWNKLGAAPPPPQLG
jgi:RHS repeat-associated protein